MRSAKAPAISAGVMMAKVIWNVMNTVSGIVRGKSVYRHCDCADAVQEQFIETADIGVHTAFGEGERIADDHPEHRHEAGDGEALHDRGEHVLLAHHAAVEQAEARDGHHQHESGRGEHPGGVAGIRLTVGEDRRFGRRIASRRRRSRRGCSGRSGSGRRRCGCLCVGGVKRRHAQKESEQNSQGNCQESRTGEFLQRHGLTPVRVFVRVTTAQPRRSRRCECARRCPARRRKSFRRRSVRSWRRR